MALPARSSGGFSPGCGNTTSPAPWVNSPRTSTHHRLCRPTRARHNCPRLRRFCSRSSARVAAFVLGSRENCAQHLLVFALTTADLLHDDR